MAHNKNQSASPLPDERIRLMGSCPDTTLRDAGITLIPWTRVPFDLGWLQSQVESMTKTDWFCRLVAIAGNHGAWLSPASFNDFRRAVPEILALANARAPHPVSEGYLTSLTKKIRRKLFTFDDPADDPSHALRNRIADTLPRVNNGIPKGTLRTMRVHNTLLIRGDAGIESKRINRPDSYAIRQEVVASIAGSLDTDLFNYANSLLIQAAKSGPGKAPANLSFIALASGWGPDQTGAAGMTHLKSIIEAIIFRRALNVTYKPHASTPLDCILSPHRLRKQSQWIIYGHSATAVASGIYAMKLSRIISIQPAPDGTPYVDETDSDGAAIYERMSRHQLTYDVMPLSAPLTTVIFAVDGLNLPETHSASHLHNPYKRILEEPLHPSQEQIPFAQLQRHGIITDATLSPVANLDPERWAFFSIRISDPDRILPIILTFGPTLKILSPLSLHDHIRQTASALLTLYS